MRRSLSNAKAPEAVEGGWHKGIIEQMEIVEAGPNAKNPGTPMFKETFRITEGEAENKVVFQNWMLDEDVSGSHRTKKLVSDLGQNPEDFDDEEFAAASTGLECWAKVTKVKERNQERVEQFGREYNNSIAGHSLTDPNMGETAEAELSETAPEDKPAAKPLAHAARPNGAKAKAAQRPASKGTPRREAR